MSQADMSVEGRISVRSAVQAAADYIQSFKDMLGNLENLRLEEIDLSEDKKCWSITLGFDITNNSNADENPLFPIVEGKNQERQYKIINVDVRTGVVQSMKIREL
ncbi:MAG: hypothetical protein AB4290_01990 [Spirulina sp.]